MADGLLRVGYYQQIIPVEGDILPDFSISLDSLSDSSDELMPGDYLGGAIQGSFAIDHAIFDRWRKLLSLAALGYDAETVWSNPDAFSQEPFYELIHCEKKAVFGPGTCFKITVDFRNTEEQIEQYFFQRASGDDSNFFQELYRIFKKAFEVSQNSGCIIFS